MLAQLGLPTKNGAPDIIKNTVTLMNELTNRRETIIKEHLMPVAIPKKRRVGPEPDIIIERWKNLINQEKKRR